MWLDAAQSNRRRENVSGRHFIQFNFKGPLDLVVKIYICFALWNAPHIVHLSWYTHQHYQKK